MIPENMVPASPELVKIAVRLPISYVGVSSHITGSTIRVLAYIRLVPSSENPVDSHETARLEEALEETNHHNLPGVIREARAKCQKAPAETCCGQPDPGGNLLEDEVVGNLSQEVSSVEDGVDLIELCSSEAQFLSHSRNICIVQISGTVSDGSEQS